MLSRTHPGLASWPLAEPCPDLPKSSVPSLTCLLHALLPLLSQDLVLFPAPLPPARKPLRDPFQPRRGSNSDDQPLLWHLIVSLPCVVYTPLCLKKFQSPSESLSPSGTSSVVESEASLESDLRWSLDSGTYLLCAFGQRISSFRTSVSPSIKLRLCSTNRTEMSWEFGT